MTERSYVLGDALRLTLALEEARFGLTPEALFDVAVRQNEKRPFLFVSKVLGKHLPIDPCVLAAAGKLLALAWRGGSGGEAWTGPLLGRTEPFPALMARLDAARETLDAPTLFVGFAETATGLARAVADAFAGDLRYVATTRVALPGPAPLTFDEAHSHARTHLLHLDGADPFLGRCRRAVLVDDELTTGRTALRLIQRLHEAFGIREFALLTLLDNSGEEERGELAERLGIEIRVVSLLRGRLLGAETGTLPRPISVETTGELPISIRTVQPGALLDDRRPLSAEQLAAQRELARTAAAELSATAGDLFLGSGEFIYLPALVAGYRGGRAFQSATQSPVLPLDGSAIVSGAKFPPVDSYSAAGYLYNIPKDVYPKAVILAEAAWLSSPGAAGLAAHLRERGVGAVEVVTL